ncbi:MAG: polyprenyl synthetase family protein, partial [Clostridiales Family XIII bacterium]|nr:polyprenyl synthetase family protein [Clostridiales Family XIII bacterium]
MIDYPEYHRLKYLVEEHLLDFLPEIDKMSITLYDSMRYSLKAEGKRIRPVLLLAACELSGGDTMQALPYACAVEYIHTYSLIHDDLPAMDDDDLRRGQPTNHKVYGEATAVLAGDGLLSSAFEAMNKDMLLYFDRPNALKQRVRAIFEISKGCGCRGMIAGQLADIEAESKTVSPELLDYIHLNKTAALIASAIIAGAYIGGAETSLFENLRAYGENLGLAFQIADDILDVTGNAMEHGKRPGKDSALR